MSSVFDTPEYHALDRTRSELRAKYVLALTVPPLGWFGRSRRLAEAYERSNVAVNRYIRTFHGVISDPQPRAPKADREGAREVK